MSEFRRERATIHFVGGLDTVTMEGDWFDRYVRHGSEVKTYQEFDDTMVNMANVTYVEVKPIEGE